jgi:hypothetical protein
MATKRTPVRPARKARVSPEAIAIYESMRECEKRRAWQRWHGLNSELCKVLGLRPWQAPDAIAHPDAKCPWPRGTAGATDWPLKQQRYRALEAPLEAQK